MKTVTRTTKISRITSDDVIGFQMATDKESFVANMIAPINDSRIGIRSIIPISSNDVHAALTLMVAALNSGDNVEYEKVRDIIISESEVDDAKVAIRSTDDPRR